MKRIIDYAGLFPPAELSLDTSIHNFAKYRNEEDSLMLSRFIIPAGRLHELKAYHKELFSDGEPFDFSILGKGTETIAEFEKELNEITHSCAEFHEYHEDRITTDFLEIKLPEEAALANDVSLVEELVTKAAHKVDGFNQTPQYVFYEAPLKESWEKDFATVIEAVSKHNKSIAGNLNTYRHAGFKLRCGGVEASMFPSPEQVAHTLNQALKYDVAVKCTAGLHHPVRHYDDSMQTRMHGFFNVFGGAMLAHAYNLTDEEFAEILREEDPEQFSFNEKNLSWRDLFVSTEEIEGLRKTVLISFGSCSFEEPRENLQKLKLL